MVAENRGMEKIDLIEAIDTIEAIEAIDSVSIRSIPSIKSIQSIKEDVPEIVAQSEEPTLTVEEEEPVLQKEDSITSEPSPTTPKIKVTYGRVINDAHLAVNVWQNMFLAAD